MDSLAACDWIIGPPITYSVWASLYGGAKIHFIQYPEEQFSETDFVDYFSLVDRHPVISIPEGEQCVEINGARYHLVFPTEKETIRV